MDFKYFIINFFSSKVMDHNGLESIMIHWTSLQAELLKKCTKIGMKTAQ